MEPGDSTDNFGANWDFNERIFTRRVRRVAANAIQGKLAARFRREHLALWRPDGIVQ